MAIRRLFAKNFVALILCASMVGSLALLLNPNDVYADEVQNPAAFAVATEANSLNLGMHQISWSALEVATSYSVYVKGPGQTEFACAATGITTTSYNYLFTLAGTYTVYVVGVNGESMVQSSTTNYTVVNTLGDFAVVNPGEFTVGNKLITWSAAQGANCYQLWIKAPEATEFTCVYEGAALSRVTEFTVPGNYSAYVVALNDYATSTSETISFTVKAAATPTPTAAVSAEIVELPYVPGNVRFAQLNITNTSSDAITATANSAAASASYSIPAGNTTINGALHSGSNDVTFTYGGYVVSATNTVEDNAGPEISNCQITWVDNNKIKIDVDVTDPSGLYIYEDGFSCCLYRDGVIVPWNEVRWVHGLAIGNTPAEHYMTDNFDIAGLSTGVDLGQSNSWINRADVTNLTAYGAHYTFTMDLSGLDITNQSSSFQLKFKLYDSYVNATTASYTVDMSRRYPTPSPTLVPCNPQVADFVERLYTIALERDSEPSGKNYWITELSNGRSGAAVAGGFFFGPELTSQNISDIDFITRLYRTFMNREPDRTGMIHWLTQLENGKTRDNVFWEFINSSEWISICTSCGINPGSTGRYAKVVDFATRLYTTCLNRAGEQTGITYWSNALTAGTFTGTEAAHEFFFGTEFTSQNLSNAEYIQRLYKTFMGRTGSDAEIAYWLNTMANGQSREAVFQGFAKSAEFSRLCTEAGIRAI